LSACAPFGFRGNRGERAAYGTIPARPARAWRTPQIRSRDYIEHDLTPRGYLEANRPELPDLRPIPVSIVSARRGQTVQPPRPEKAIQAAAARRNAAV
jgi:hypothetical protein